MTAPAVDLTQSQRWEPRNDQEHLEELKGLDNATIDHLRKRAQNQLYFMAKGVMGYKDVNLATHGRFCRAVQDEDNDRQLDLMPRGHLKSSIGTEADCVRLAVKDPENTRILIVNEILENAQAFHATIRQQFEKNEFLRFLFPHLIHSRFTGPGVDWSGKSATLPRSTTYKEPTWMPLGVGGAVTSKHFSHIKPDDLIGLEARKSPAALKAAIQWNRNIESLSIDAFSTKIHWIGTRWGKNDLYADIIQRYGEDLKIFSRGAIENGKIIFPEKYDWKFYRRIQEETPDIWAAQYMNDPSSDVTSDFDGSSVKYFKFDNDGNVVYKHNNIIERIHWTALDRVITVDPNGGSKTSPDEAAVTVTGVASDDKVFVLASACDRFTPTELVDKIFQLAQRWRPRLVGIEKAAQQNTRHYFEKKMREELMFFMITDLNHRNRDKTDRIRTSLEPVIAERSLHILHTQTKLEHQLKNFPDITNDDAVDSLAYATEIWRKPVAQEQQKKNSDIVKKLLARRNPHTGYGPALVQ